MPKIITATPNRNRLTYIRIQGYLFDKFSDHVYENAFTLSHGGQGGRHGRTGGGGHGAGHGRTGAGHGEHPPPGHTEHGLRSLQDATHGFVVYG